MVSGRACWLHRQIGNRPGGTRQASIGNLKAENVAPVVCHNRKQT